jgi:iron(III) transport system permease protein
VLGALIAWLSLRMKSARRWIALLDQIAMAPLAIPGMIFGVGLAWLYLVLPVPIYGTRWILFFAYVAIHLPFAVRICMSGLSQLHPELEEAGAVAVAGWLTRLTRIVLRLAAPSLVASVLRSRCAHSASTRRPSFSRRPAPKSSPSSSSTCGRAAIRTSFPRM